MQSAIWDGSGPKKLKLKLYWGPRPGGEQIHRHFGRFGAQETQNDMCGQLELHLGRFGTPKTELAVSEPKKLKL